ncbi:NADH:ubiquinone reductase (Na(+)-transporting) subunit B [Ferrimonas sp. SCSIO 43195]|uniref:NADH:ubiquinone reductase (Na(+)-transporting) subunit B n=1 Tax=Ferrimonas sp. SCSIO 43195 TaxID=2822844 RepID=UPI002075F114|nr:NADH:ubiquinone reductase (Na(+)-transporting) subunit B [Ferrimonas sp. SCSIO 43195]USD38420.1 NADH:ubiquinone reductase (Na(+)-transporting) subunit B [Ferrimonas sp. SCSIO 43195]
MTDHNQRGQDAYYAHGNSMKDYLRSLFITYARPTSGKVHVRDGIDVKRTMHVVMLCLMPAMLFGMYNQGLQAQLALQAGATAADAWQLGVFNALFGPLGQNSSAVALFGYGASFYLPIYATALLVNLFWEVVFARVRNQELHEGFFVTSMLFALVVPISTPLWMVAMGISFGVVMAKEVFGGMGCNFLNPTLAGLAFLYFAYPTVFGASGQLVAVDGFSGATTLAQAAAGKVPFADYPWYQAFSDAAWWDAFLGFTPGAVGETSTLALLIGGSLLMLSSLASWRIVGGVFIGMVATATLFNLIGSTTNPMFAMPWTWHLVSGGFAIGMLFMATDPVTSTYTRKGRWAYGVLIGVMAVLIRVINPKMAEGMMLAILFSNLWAPIFDYLVARANIKRRQARNGL